MLRGAVIAFLAILVVAATLIGIAIILQGTSANLIVSPAEWLRTVDNSVAFDAVSTAAELLAAILAIAITVVAIVVELAANRYSHRITTLFVREPINIVVMGFFVVATIQSVWVSLTLSEAAESAIVPNAGFLSSILMVTISLVILLPYFALVLSFLSPVNVIGKISGSALEAVQGGVKSVRITNLNGLQAGTGTKIRLAEPSQPKAQLKKEEVALS